MLRRLLIMRHAKSSWNNATLSDHERPLNGRGQRAAPEMGQQLAEAPYNLERAYVSDATRTTETWLYMAPYLPDLTVSYHAQLYGGTLQDIERLIGEASPSTSTILVLGHNPGFSAAASYLTGEYIELKTAHIAVLETESDDWEGPFERNSWTLAAVLSPKEAIKR